MKLTIRQKLIQKGYKHFQTANNQEYYKSMTMNHNTLTIVVDKLTDQIVDYYIGRVFINKEEDIKRLEVDWTNFQFFVDEINK